MARTLEIVDACRFCLDELVYEYPEEPTPAGKTPQGHLEDISRAGARINFTPLISIDVTASSTGPERTRGVFVGLRQEFSR